MRFYHLFWHENELVNRVEIRWWPNLGGDGVVSGLVDDLSVGFCRKDGGDEQLVDLVCWLLVERDLIASKPLQSNSSSSNCFHL